MIAAIEIFNKPQFAYRDECFAILAINAWELLLKARVIATSNESLQSIFEYQATPTQSGRRLTRRRLVRTRSGNPKTISLGKAIVLLDADPKSRLPNEVKQNLDALLEIRDNSVHLLAQSPLLAARVLEIGTATVKNFIEAGRTWFGMALSDYSLSLMPIGFVSGAHSVQGLLVSRDEQRVLDFVTSLIREQESTPNSGFHVALQVNLEFTRVSGSNAITVSTTSDPAALKVTLREEDIRKRWPWNYDKLNRECRNRYLDFKMDRKYHQLRKALELSPKYANVRLLDPDNPDSGRKTFYNPNILQEFDKEYRKKS